MSPKWLNNKVVPEEGSKESKGPNESRSMFARDYGSIIYKSQFRRLSHKTQMFTKIEKDFPRTRLTHSIEVSYIGRDLVRKLDSYIDLDHREKRDLEDLVASSALAHDIGHPPFGHSGAKILEELTQKSSEGKFIFDDNKQVVRLLLGCSFKNILANTPFYVRDPFYVTSSLIDSVMKYKNSMYKEGKDTAFYPSEKEKAVEVLDLNGTKDYKHPMCYLMEVADDISYIASDISDNLYLNYLSKDEVNDLLRTINLEPPTCDNKDGDNFRKYSSIIIKYFLETIDDNFTRLELTKKSTENLPKIFFDYLKKNGNKEEKYNFLYCGENGLKLLAFKSNLYKTLLNNPHAGQAEIIAKKVITGIWDEFIDMLNSSKISSHPFYKILPNHVQFKVEYFIRYVEEKDMKNKSQLASDFLSSMSDNFAIELYSLISDPSKLKI